MNAAGMSGNLMSMGAIDFGLIVDGSVIIVENAVRRLRDAHVAKGAAPTSQERSDIVDAAAVEVRSASVFGEIIIAIVYLPILALRGIEGKLFHPMATTVLFALAGAFIFSLTVVPVLSSYFLKPGTGENETWFMRTSRRAYVPVLAQVMRMPWRTVVVGLVLLTLGGAVLSRLGAEFVPQLDEGDLLVEVRRLPGVALTESIATDRRIQQALLKIAEVSHVVSKTGSPELATDSMGIEETDVYVALRPRSTWRSGLDKDGLKREVAEALERDVPEVSAALSQPIQMRTNELVAGTRSDVAVQIYGSDLDQLQQLGDQVAAAIRSIPGAVDVRAAQTAGLTYLRIRPDRARLARYGLTVEDVNTLTETIAVGRPVGSVFEGDRRFSLVVKMDHQYQGDLDELRSLPLKSNLGQTVPLGDVADVSVEKGPALVNREKQARRLAVEFNTRGRDVVSVVRDAQAAVSRAVTLPTAYRLEWGGQFENYLAARRTLMVVVPLALGLILFLLWLAFRQIRPALLIFINIPFGAVGGVLALWARGMPFSISAGVGFIALFGVAVLNGLVLLSFTLHLERDGASPGLAVVKAAEMRLRPVLMTALVAALGFVPMALSRAPGSEVQRPLATVVIGGLVTATALTLLLFPSVYALTHRRPRSADADHTVRGEDQDD
jgi:heavy metal efflux system protein